MHLCSWSIKITHDCGHAGLVAHSCGKVDWFLRVILGKAGNVSASTQWSHDFSITNLFTLPRCLDARFRGRKASEPVGKSQPRFCVGRQSNIYHVAALRTFDETWEGYISVLKIMMEVISILHIDRKKEEPCQCQGKGFTLMWCRKPFGLGSQISGVVCAALESAKLGKSWHKLSLVVPQRGWRASSRLPTVDASQ